MGENSSIAWTDHTVNFVIGCTKVDELCAHCYADTMDDRRFSKTLDGGTKEKPVRHWGPKAPRYLRIANACEEIRLLNDKARKAGRVDRVFINSLSDTFEGRKDLIDARWALFECVLKSDALIFQILTKRPENITKMVPTEWLIDWPKNAWIGTSVGHQKSADTRIPELLKVPAPTRFLSCEPLLNKTDISRWLNLEHRSHQNKPGDPWIDDGWHPAEEPTLYVRKKLHWVIAGGESGDGFRMMDLAWMRQIKDQCKAANVPYFCKQDSSYKPGQRGRIPDDLWIQEFPV